VEVISLLINHKYVKYVITLVKMMHFLFSIPRAVRNIWLSVILYILYLSVYIHF